MSCFVVAKASFARSLVGLDSLEFFFGVEAAFVGDVSVFDGAAMRSVSWLMAVFFFFF